VHNTGSSVRNLCGAYARRMESDGSSHFHVWFQGRPARQLELYGWGNVLWSQVLAPLPAEVVDAHHATVLDAFVRDVGGTRLS
jgi:hypothetical protein